VKDRPLAAKGVGPVQEQHVQVGIQVQGRAEALDQSDRAATGTKPPAFAAERDQVLVSAAVALDAQKPVLQQSAFQVILELLADKPR
jgi:hypothetical protein